MKKNATALRAFTHADDSFADGDVILGMSAGQFNDWSAEGVDLVREATAAEVARAKGETAPAAKKPARKRTRKPATSGAPAGTPITDTPPAENADA